MRQLLKMDQFCYKMRQLLQIAEFITKYVDTRGSSRLCYIDEIKSTELYVGSIGVLQVEIHIIFLSIFISFILN